MIGITVTLGTAYADGRIGVTHGAVAEPPATATIAADIATLVADGASPTQGHVNSLNSHWTTYTATAGALTANATLFIDPSAITTQPQARAVIR